jgi:hypothetical protein
VNRPPNTAGSTCPGGRDQQVDLWWIQLDARRALEQPAVHVRRALERAAGRPFAGSVQPLEQLTEDIEAACLRIGLQPLGGVGEQQLREHAQVLGEAAPRDLQGEVARQLRGDTPLGERHVQPRHGVHGPLGKVDGVDREVRRAPPQEVERLHSLGKVIQHEVDPRGTGTLGDRDRELAGLPDHEAIERAQKDVAGSPDALVGEAGPVPVVEHLPPVGLRKLLGRPLRLHLDQDVALPEQVGEAAAGVAVLEAQLLSFAPSGVVAVEEFP